MADETQDAKRYPVDVETLQKGDVIPASRLIEWSGHQPWESKYRLKCMGLADYIEMMSEMMGRPLLHRWEGDSIRIMTDDEAVDRLNSRFHMGLRKAAKNLGRQYLVDRDQLDEARRKDHEHHMLSNSRMMQAAFRARLDDSSDAGLLNE